jgi:protocatechuate 3,4-dioxygenase beta subunit
MSDRSRLSRRTLLQAALGGVALAAAPLAPAATPHQTDGPFFPKRDQPDKDFDMTRIDGHADAAAGEVVVVEGRVLDEKGAPVADALVDVWQANARGRYAHERDANPAPLDPHFQGWAQLRTDADGRYRVRTIQPGAYPVEAGWTRPPHIHFKVARRGYHELTTQMYFAGDPLNAIDRLLLSVPEAERASLVVDFVAADGGERTGRFDLVLRRA